MRIMASFISCIFSEPPQPDLQLVSAFSVAYSTEKVVLKCVIDSSSDWNIRWNRNNSEIHGSDFSLSEENSKLTITVETSAVYTCQGEHKTKSVLTKVSNPRQIDVQELPRPTLTRQSPWADVFETESVTFSCQVPISGWSFSWYKNGEKLGENTELLSINDVTKDNQGSYTCKVHHHSRNLSSKDSNPAMLNVYSEKAKPHVAIIKAFEPMYPGESIEFSCRITIATGWDYVWYLNGSEIPAANKDTYKIDTIDHSNSGQYFCKVKRGSFFSEESDKLPFQVSELPKPTLKLQSPWSDVFERESVTFGCQVHTSGWTFSWYKNGEKLGENTQLLSIDDVTKDNQGSYTCKVHLQSRHLSSKDSNAIILNVYSEKAKPHLTKSQSFETMYPGESIEFNCSVRVATDWIYMWYLNGSEIQGVNNHIYRIDKIDHSNHGHYFCKAKRGQFFSEESDKLSLQVSDPPQPSLKRLTSWSDVFEKEKVEMSCNVSDPTWTFTWYKDNKKLQKTSSLTWDEKGSKLTISSIAQDHRGNYACKANLALRGVISKSSIELHLTVYESLPLPKLAKNPNFNLMYVGENVAFTCKVSVSSGWEYKWYKDSDVLANTNQSITINLGLQHKGTYWCSASRGDISNLHSNKIRQDVEEIPVPELKLKNKQSDVFPKEMVQLSCMMPNSSGWTYTWYRDGGLIQADNNVVIGTNGATISFPSDPSLHQTQPYTCEAELKHRSVRSNFSSTVTLQVYDALPNVTLLQSPEHSLLHSGDSVSFSCNVDISSGWEFLWYKNGAQINKGNQHNISSAQVKDEGSYACRAERESFLLGKSEDMKIKVKERPEAEIILLTGWGEVLSTDSLVLQCKVEESGYKWNYTWFRGDVAVGEVPAEKYIVTPQNDPDQSQYSCKGIRSERPTYSKNSPLFKTKNLLLKRRILLSISGCLFFGIILAFLGCIYFKIRKPVVAEEKPEENELFLTLKKQLEHTDNPCPLVEYITDKALNEAPRESDGLISSDSTELTITTQEDQAAVSSATENGGAMISFQKVS
uniref:Ig-like domain-containing protein n=1 Tax=Oryzias melastigma TaxID=30732 RepID=A0A3B3C9E7_ORYME